LTGAAILVLRSSTFLQAAPVFAQAFRHKSAGVLADALEEVGGADEALLGHLRGPGPHVRGCWAVDLVLAGG
jgi:hypothetical protein